MWFSILYRRSWNKYHRWTSLLWSCTLSSTQIIYTCYICCNLWERKRKATDIRQQSSIQRVVSGESGGGGGGLAYSYPPIQDLISSRRVRPPAAPLQPQTNSWNLETYRWEHFCSCCTCGKSFCVHLSKLCLIRISEETKTCWQGDNNTKQDLPKACSGIVLKRELGTS